MFKRVKNCRLRNTIGVRESFTETAVRDKSAIPKDPDMMETSKPKKNASIAFNILGVILFALGLAATETFIMLSLLPAWTVAGSYSGSSFFFFAFLSGLLIGFGILLIRRDA